MYSILRSLLGSFRLLQAVIFCLLALASLTTMSVAQQLCTGTTPCVTTWHNDTNRTGWQANEAILNPSNVSGAFGLVWQWGSPTVPLQGRVFAQPLALANLPTVGTCQSPCSLVFAATEQDMLYAFNAASNSQTPAWSLNLAAQLPGPGGPYTYVDCTNMGGSNYSNFSMCKNPVVGSYIGVTGTPVIDVSTYSFPVLYVAVAAAPESQNGVSYYLLAVNAATGSAITGGAIQISGQVTGSNRTASVCTSNYPSQGNNQGYTAFDSNNIQRSALLLLNGRVYVAFASDAKGEADNGWMFAYSFSYNSQTNTGSFTQQAAFASTPYGTGGGFWGSGAGPASDGAYVYAATGNGTTFDLTTGPPIDAGDTLLKLGPGLNGPLSILDYYVPSDVYTYNNEGLCLADEDVGSGGVLLVPSNSTYGYRYNGKSIVINADKQSDLYVADKDNLGQFQPNDTCGGGTYNNIQCILSPCKKDGQGNCDLPLYSGQGYWSSPTYWFDGSNAWLYHSPTAHDDTAAAPYPVYAYQLGTGTGGLPILANGNATTATSAGAPVGFCQYTPTTSVSSNGTQSASTGILWGIEHQNSNNNPNQNNCEGIATGQYAASALHAFAAEPGQGFLTQLYDSGTAPENQYIGKWVPFSVPTVFNGFVYVGTSTEVDVFGLCTYGPLGKCMGH